ncbi:MAG: AIR synthase-related protein, partial [Aureliella sp.]
KVGDVLIASGPIGQHGIAVMAARENLQLQPAPRSDCAPLVDACRSLWEALGSDLHAMRDATRGGVAAVMHEWAEGCGATMQLVESQIPVANDTRGACELLGLDPLVVANEGTFMAAVAPQAAERALESLHRIPVSASAQVIGRVIEPLAFPVVIERIFSKLQPLDEPSGAQLPRIC